MNPLDSIENTKRFHGQFQVELCAENERVQIMPDVEFPGTCQFTFTQERVGVGEKVNRIEMFTLPFSVRFCLGCGE